MSDIAYKYNEKSTVEEIQRYIDKTYSEHYSQNKFQATEFILDSGHGDGFCIGNIMKYAQRVTHKGTPADWRKDMFKVIHYAIIWLHKHDTEQPVSAVSVAGSATLAPNACLTTVVAAVNTLTPREADERDYRTPSHTFGNNY